eukprot:TRINITY_DN614_c0_g2_i5.p2 TRINITY_DN614_c0_g2~~TRINITY_DN614_c0_g2_i5.p2  ORF type:complete len:134 (-),score=57.90 TRINITY_DN614_c0_g2_i5:18-377(-)
MCIRDSINAEYMGYQQQMNRYQPYYSYEGNQVRDTQIVAKILYTVFVVPVMLIEMKWLYYWIPEAMRGEFLSLLGCIAFGLYCFIHIIGICCVWIPNPCLLYTSPSPRDLSTSRMPSSA